MSVLTTTLRKHTQSDTIQSVTSLIHVDSEMKSSNILISGWEVMFGLQWQVGHSLTQSRIILKYVKSRLLLQ